MRLARVGSEQAQGDAPADERTRFAAAGPVGTYVDVLPTVASGRQGHGPPRSGPTTHPTDRSRQQFRGGAPGLKSCGTGGPADHPNGPAAREERAQGFRPRRKHK